MENKQPLKKYYIFTTLFIILNILATYIVTTESLNHYITTFDYSFMGIFNSFIGNLSFLLLLLFIINLSTKNLRLRMRIMLIVTFLLNGFLFWINIYNRFYGTSFTFKAFQIFKNPAGNFGLTIFFEAMKEIITYFRIIIFIPLIVLIIVYNRSRKNETIKQFKVSLNHKTLMTHFLLIVLMLFFNITVFTKTSNDIVIVESLKPNYATQNLGLYNYLLLDAMNFDYNVNDESIEQIFDNLDDFNKNKESYTNLLNNKTYTKEVLKKDGVNLNGKLIDNLNDDDSLTGLLEDYNLVFIHLETFNYFLIDYYETNEYLFNLNALMEESYVFDNFYTNVGLGNSSDAELSVLTGNYANGTSTIFWDYDKEDEVKNFEFNSLAKLFNNKNYNTNSFHGNTGDFYNRENTHPDMIEFNKFYDRDKMLEESNLTIEEVIEMYDHDAGIWLSDRFTIDFFNEFNENMNDERFMSFLITILPHTPFYYDPYNPKPKESNMYKNELVKEVNLLTLKYFNYMKYYNEIIGQMINDPLDNTAYIFYGDHGSSLNFNDVNYLYDNELSSIEVREKLLETIGIIYVPGNESVTKNINNNEVVLKEGLLKGKQSLVRDQVDLYRTIVDLFNLELEEEDYLYGVHGMSSEPSFALDNKSLFIITDDFTGNLRNNKVLFKNNQLDLDRFIIIKDEINKFKKYSDKALNNNLYKIK